LSAGFRRLFSPLHVGGVTFRNRLVMPPLSSGTAGTGGEVTDKMLRFYDRVEPGVVYPFGRLFERSMGIWSETHRPRL